MRDYARISPRFWTGATGKALRRNPDAQRLALYLLTCPSANMIGVFYVAAPTICHEVGLDAEMLAALWAVLELLDFAHYDEETEMVWVPNMAREQLDDALKPADKRVVQVVRQVDSIRRHRFARMFWDRYAGPFSLAANPEADGLVALFATPSQGVSAPLPMGKPPRREEQDQALEKDPDLSPPLPLEASDARSEERAEVDPLRRDRDFDVPLTAGELTALFSRLWEIRWSMRWTGQALAARPARLFMDGFPLGLAEKTAAAREIKPAIAAYLAIEKDYHITRKHPFEGFVKDFNSLRGPRAQTRGEIAYPKLSARAP